MTGKDLVTDAGVSQLRSERAAEAIGLYITGPYDSGSWFGRYAASLKSGAEEAAAFFETVFKSEVRHGAFVEGACGQVTVSRYERDPKARAACLLHYKRVCFVCEMDFESRYGELGKGFIHVHHRTPLAKGAQEVDPVRDLLPVCPNCHAMLHRGPELTTPEELREIVASTARERGGL